MSKTCFTCFKCYFFPLEFQRQAFFLNSDTFKCPVCNQLTKFNKSKSYLLESQYEVYTSHNKGAEQQQFSGNKSSKLQKQNAVTKAQQFQLIYIESSPCFMDFLYLNPINPELSNSFNLDKEKVLREKKDTFFCLNEAILRQILAFQSMKTKKSRGFEHGLRKVRKAEHLWYCLDKYVQKIKNSIKQRDKDDFLILRLIPNKKVNQRSASNEITQKDAWTNVQSTQQDSLDRFWEIRFSLSTYDKQNKTQNKVNQSQSSIQTDMFKAQVEQFIKYFYDANFIQHIGRQKQSYQANSQFYVSKFKSIAIFSDQQKYNLGDPMINLLENNQTQVALLNFYFSNPPNSHEDKTKDRMLLKTQHISMYVPHCKNRTNFQDLLAVSFVKTQKDQKNIKRHGQQVGKSTVFFSNQLRMKNPQDKETQLNLIQKSTEQQKGNQCQEVIFLFWSTKRTIKNAHGNTNRNFDQTDKQFRVNKIKAKTVTLAIKQAIFILKTKNEQQFVEVMKQQINAQMTKILQKNQCHSYLDSNLIQIDRIYCQFEDCIMVYAFSFENIIEQNFQELDFLGLDALPDQLKSYSRTYQKVHHKQNCFNDNPFRKGNNRVSMIRQQQDNRKERVQNSFENQNSSEESDRQTL